MFEVVRVDGEGKRKDGGEITWLQDERAEQDDKAVRVWVRGYRGELEGEERGERI